MIAALTLTPNAAHQQRVQADESRSERVRCMSWFGVIHAKEPMITAAL